MISASGTIARIEKDGGTDSYPQGIATLATLPDYPSLALYASAGKENVLFAHYAFKYGEAYRARVVADSGTVSSPNYVRVITAIRQNNLFDDVSLIVPCDAGKASVLYAIDARGDATATFDEATAESFDAVSDYSVTGVPDLVVARVSQTSVSIDVDNIGSQTARVYIATGVQGNFAQYGDLTTAGLPDTDTVTAGDFKYKASFIVSGTRNGSPHTVEGRKCSPRYAIDPDSTSV